MVELCPREQRQTQINGGGIQDKNLFCFSQSNLIMALQVAGMLYENQRQILIHLPWSVAIGIGKCAQLDLMAQTHVIAFAIKGIQCRCNVAKAITESELTETHADELFPTGKGTRLLPL